MTRVIENWRKLIMYHARSGTSRRSNHLFFVTRLIGITFIGFRRQKDHYNFTLPCLYCFILLSLSSPILITSYYLLSSSTHVWIRGSITASIDYQKIGYALRRRQFYYMASEGSISLCLQRLLLSSTKARHWTISLLLPTYPTQRRQD